MRSDMLLGIGSITKTFVAVMILQLIEEGLLSLEQTIAGVLGESVEDIPNATTATIGPLLNHTSGIPSWEEEPAWIRDGRGSALDVHRIWGKADTLAYIRGRRPLAPPGVAFRYANTNYTLLGLMLERVTGLDLVTALQRRILLPLDLKGIFLEGFEAVPGRRPSRYHWLTDTFRSQAGVNEAFHEARGDLIDVSASNLSVEWAAGGLLATARALVLFGSVLREGQLLKPQGMRSLMEWTPARVGVQVGHGVFRSEYPGGLTTIGHDGDVLGFSATLFWVEHADLTIAVLCNVGSMHASYIPPMLNFARERPQIVAAAMSL
jgi:D-alanyl-D-alanine carboxypeptidase